MTSFKTTQGKYHLLDALQRKIGYFFQEQALLKQALTHSSAHHERATPHNERLEFLGDRVLALAITNILYHTYPEASEGELSRRLNTLVRRETCAQVALDLGLMKVISAGRSMPTSAIAKSVNVLGDVCEALVGALYLEGGLEVAQTFVEQAWLPYLQQETFEKDSKTFLQEWALGQGLAIPLYEVLSRHGPEHAPLFVVRVSVPGKGDALGEGPSKRRAEHDAARRFLDLHLSSMPSYL